MLQMELRALEGHRKYLDGAGSGDNFDNKILNYFGTYYDKKFKTANMVMEYMPNGSFEDSVKLLYGHKQSGKLDAEIYRRWVASVGRNLFLALSNFHSGNRVHRDIKPANLLMGKWGEVKLSDFGLARSVEAR